MKPVLYIAIGFAAGFAVATLNHHRGSGGTMPPSPPPGVEPAPRSTLPARTPPVKPDTSMASAGMGEPAEETDLQAGTPPARDKDAERAKEERELADSLKDPRLQTMIRAHERAELNSKYADLFSYLKLSPDDLDHLKYLLVERDMVEIERLIEQVDLELGGLETGELLPSEESYDERIRVFLGDEDYGMLKDYEDTHEEREHVMGLREALPYDIDDLDKDQQHELIVALREARSSVESEHESKIESLLEGGISGPMEALNTAYLERAAGILNPEQLAIFEAYLQGKLDTFRAIAEFGQSQTDEGEE